MRKAFVGVVSLAVLVAVIQTWAQAPQEKYSDPSQFHLSEPGVPIAGIPVEEALKIYERHAEKLRQLPGAVSVSFMAEGLMVATANPAALPPAVEGLPVFAVPPVDPRAAGGLDYALSNPPPPPAPEPPHGQHIPRPVECPSYTHFDPEAGRCRLNEPRPPEPDRPTVQLIPPPPGVVVLRPNQAPEHADSCPPGFQELKGGNNWRFCDDPNNPQEIPPLWVPPINGIPYEKALEIHNRHVNKLVLLPGVDGAGMGIDGIYVNTKNPELLPKEVEGVPIKPLPPLGGGRTRSHSSATPLRPLRGALEVGQLYGGTLTGIVLSDGKPWLVFPSHMLSRCGSDSRCPPGSPLSSCEHYLAQGQLVQPWSVSSPPSVGYIQRWTRLVPDVVDQFGVVIAITPREDVAAAFMDINTVEGDGSLSASRQVEVSNASPPAPFLGTPASPVASTPGMTVRAKLRSAITGTRGSHEFQLRIDRVNLTVPQIFTDCISTRFTLASQTEYTMLDPYIFQDGDSGAPIFDSSERIIGTFNASRNPPNEHIGWGTNVNAIRSVLNYDTWYGTDTVNDNSIGTFYTPTAGWTIDNGNGKWDGPNCLNVTDTTPTDDHCFTYGTPNSDRPVTGDWNNDGSVTVGVYRTTTNPQQFLLRDANSAGAEDYPPISTGPPSFGYKPVAGKWNGVNQTAKVGIFNPGTAPGSQRGFYLDNGDKIINGCPGPDHCFFTGSITLAEDLPIAGDWDNNGSVTIGVFRPSTSTFYLSNADPAALPDNSQLTSWNLVIPAGSPSFGYLPAVGDWTGPSGQIKTKLGVFRPSTGTWYLDNGNRSFPGCAEDQCPSAFGGPNQLPVSFGKTKIKAN